MLSITKGRAAYSTGWIFAYWRQNGTHKKTPQKMYCKLTNMNSSKNFQETKPKYKVYTPKEAKIITASKLRRRVNYFTNLFPHYCFHSSDKKITHKKKSDAFPPAIWSILRHTYHRQKTVTLWFCFYLTTHTVSQESQECKEINAAFHSFAWNFTSRQNIINPQHAKALPDQIEERQIKASYQEQ